MAQDQQEGGIFTTWGLITRSLIYLEYEWDTLPPKFPWMQVQLYFPRTFVLWSSISTPSAFSLVPPNSHRRACIHFLRLSFTFGSLQYPRCGNVCNFYTGITFERVGILCRWIGGCHVTPLEICEEDSGFSIISIKRGNSDTENLKMLLCLSLECGCQADMKTG